MQDVRSDIDSRNCDCFPMASHAYLCLLSFALLRFTEDYDRSVLTPLKVTICIFIFFCRIWDPKVEASLNYNFILQWSCIVTYSIKVAQ